MGILLRYFAKSNLWVSLFLLSIPARGFASKSWSVDMLSLLTPERLSEATISNVSIHDEGHVFLSHNTKELVKIGPDVFVWDVILWEDFICIATRGKGLVLISIKDNSVRQIHSDREITAMSLAPNKKLYFAATTVSQGFVSIYSLANPNTDAVESVIDIQQTQFVWSMVFLRDDMYLACAAEQGTVLQVTGLSSGKPMANSIFVSKESAFLKLVPTKGSLYVSSTDKAFLYHIPVLQTDAPEILYEPDAPCQISDFFFQGGKAFLSVVRKHPIFLDVPGPKPGIGVRSLQKPAVQKGVIAEDTKDLQIPTEMGNPDNDGHGPDAEEVSSSHASAAGIARDIPRGGGYYPGPQKSVLYSLDENGYLQEEMSHPSKIFTAITKFQDHSIGVLLYDEKNRSTSLVSYSQKEKGRKSYRLLATFDSALIHRVLPKDDKVFFVSTAGNVMSIDSKISQSGELILPTFDAGNKVRWGYFSHVIHGPESPSKMSTVRFFARTGQSADTNRLWSDWQECVDSRVPLSGSRFIQFKVVFPKEAASLKLSDFQLYYAHPNRAPIISKFLVQLIAAKTAGSYSNRSGENSPIAWAAEPPGMKKIFLQWLVSDPDQDDPPVSIYFRLRRPDEMNMSGWSPLLSMPEQFRDATVDTFYLDEGYYQFKLVVSDKSKNTPEMAESSSAISRVIFVDNGRPKILDVEIKNGALQFFCKDKHSVVANVRVSFDLGKTFQSLSPKDGLFDQKEEYFLTKIPEDVLKDTNTRVFIIIASDIHGNERRIVTTYANDSNGDLKK